MKIVSYLFGAGATHAETMFARSDTRVLASEITEGIQRRLESESAEMNSSVGNDLYTKGVDVEQLISLYESTGTAIDNRAAHFLRNSFMDEVSSRLSKLDEDGRRFQPVLMASLFEMHQQYSEQLQEEIGGVLTLNYDDFIERAVSAIGDSVDYGFTISLGDTETTRFGLGRGMTLLKLHGSFNWTNDFPPKIVERAHSSADDCLWIPPGVEKKREKYPFNVLWGRAKETLDCDILRVVGCSLSRNDWQLISLLHAAKRVRGFTIEYIDYEDTGKWKEKEYPYLGILRILSLEGFRKYLAEETAHQDPTSKEIEEYAEHRQQFNCFHEWVKFRKRFLENALGERADQLSTSQFINQI